MTYKEAHQIILDHFEKTGWAVKRIHNMQAMKIPHATSASGRFRLYFKARSIYRADAPNLSFKDARTITYDTPSIKEWAEAIVKARGKTS